MKAQERTWAEISLENVLYNYCALRGRLRKGAGVLGVVKADAYGHGALPIARLLEKNGCEYLAVATVEEAVKLRCGGITSPILILGFTPPSETETLIEFGITQTISSLQAAKDMSEKAALSGKRLKIHLKADSGMGRLGIICHGGRDAVPEMMEIMSLPGLETEGIFTHFAESETESGDYTDMQLEAFTSLYKSLETISGGRFKIRHCANSGAMINYEETHLDMVRLGIVLYGCYPGGKAFGGIELKAAMEFRTRITQIKELEPGWSVSYGRKYLAPAARRVAVINAGYADGLHRAASGKIDFLLHGKRVHQIGNICMDQCMIDISDVSEASVGDVVTLFGYDGDGYISVEEMAAAAGTISYEILCSVSGRVPRVYAQS